MSNSLYDMSNLKFIKMKKVKSRVHLSICTCPHYTLPNVPEFRRKYPDWRRYNDAIYLNNGRISGPRDYNGSVIYDTERSDKIIKTIDILRALDIPDEIINQIEFED